MEKAFSSRSSQIFPVLFHCCDQSAPVKAAPVKPVKVENGDDDDIDLFGSDEDDEEAARLKQERVDAYAAKKSKKPALIAKSSILLDVKPVRVLLNCIMLHIKMLVPL